MDDENKNRLLKAKLSEIVKFHRGWGAGIRNHFKLWSNVDLRKDCGSPSMHPDDASTVIMKAVWYHLHGQPASNARIEDYQKYLKQAVEKMYYEFRCQKSGVRKSDKAIYNFLKRFSFFNFFKMDFKEYRTLASDLDAKNPIESIE